MTTRVAIVGGGPAGSLLAILLARRGVSTAVYERSAEFSPRATGGRSINLALAARGLAALERAALAADVAPLLTPMRGRMLHDGAVPRFLPYGQRTHEQIYSVSRAALNAMLYRLAAERHGVEFRFEHRCVGVDAAGAPVVESRDGRAAIVADAYFAADGAGSDVRRALAAQGAVAMSEELLDHGYKELTIARAADGGFALEPHALHIWPRGEFMLIALPNPDRSFTATLFLPHAESAGSVGSADSASSASSAGSASSASSAGFASFAGIAARDVRGFFAREFPDALPLFADLEDQYAAHPTGILGTVSCRPWSAGRLLLIGDAAHAIVPFHGQGMNAAFEDCAVLDAMLAEAGVGTNRPNEPRADEPPRGSRHSGDRRGAVVDWPALFARFERARAPDTRAIAEMALENYREMRNDVRDPRFELRAAVAFELERRFPGRFIPRYSMVMFHPEIGYAEAQRRGAAQARVVAELTSDATVLADVALARAPALLSAAGL